VSPDAPTPGSPAPDFRAPSNKGHTLGPESFGDRLAVVLVFLDGIGTPEERARLWGFDAVLPEFGRRRVQLLGVVPASARDLRDATQDSAMTLLADADRSIGAAYGVDPGDRVVVLVDRHGTVATVVRGEDARPDAVLLAVDRMVAEQPDGFEPHPSPSASGS
jgi:peroxiredoxin